MPQETAARGRVAVHAMAAVRRLRASAARELP
jgi:hypothetical protein